MYALATVNIILEYVYIFTWRGKKARIKIAYDANIRKISNFLYIYPMCLDCTEVEGWIKGKEANNTFLFDEMYI